MPCLVVGRRSGAKMFNVQLVADRPVTLCAVVDLVVSYSSAKTIDALANPLIYNSLIPVLSGTYYIFQVASRGGAFDL